MNSREYTVHFSNSYSVFLTRKKEASCVWRAGSSPFHSFIFLCGCQPAKLMTGSSGCVVGETSVATRTTPGPP